MDTEVLPPMLLLMLFACFSPGPNNILCAAHGSKYSVRETLWLMVGMGLGWSVLGLLIGLATSTFEQYDTTFEVLGFVGAAYIGFLGIAMYRSSPLKAEDETQRLGFKTGVALQVVNGKAWAYFLALMTTFGTLLGSGLPPKLLIILLNLVFGVAALLVWATFGAYLSTLFSSERGGVYINRSFGIALIGVAVSLVLV